MKRGILKKIVFLTAALVLGLSVVFTACITASGDALASSTKKIGEPIYKLISPEEAPQSSAWFTHAEVSPYGTWPGHLEGKIEVEEGRPSNYKIAVYIFVGGGWWTKPYWSAPWTEVGEDGSFSCLVTTGGQDQLATKIAAFLVPTDYELSDEQLLRSGQSTLPEELEEDSADKIVIDRLPKLREIEFSGYRWLVKTSGEGTGGPGPNYFSDSEENVWVDDQDQLHLKITRRNGRWYCSEVISKESFGYGKYIFYLESNVDQLDENVVLGLFTWDDTSSEYHHREIDIEFARWGEEEGENAQFVVQPYYNSGNRHRFDIQLSENRSVHSFEWNSESISFQSLHGHYATPSDESYIIESWNYTGEDIPEPGDENARINLWLFGHNPPSDDKEVEIIIKKFEFLRTSEEKAYEHLHEVMDKYHDSFDVYTDLSAAGNHFVCLGKMASEGDEDAVNINPASTNNPYSGATCIEGRFYARGDNWGGWYLLNGVLEGEETQPKPNWGGYPEAGFDLTGATKLTFWARGEEGGEKVEFFTFGAGRSPLTGEPVEPYPDSCPKVSLGYITLSADWTKYTIDLKNVDLSYVIGGFGWVSNAWQNNNEDITFYLDNIQYDKSRLQEPRFLLSYETTPSTLDFDRIMKNVAFVYDNALALLAFISRGTDEDWHRAKLIADAFVYAQNHDRYFDDGRLRNAYQAGGLILFPGWKPHGKENTVRMPGWWDPNNNQWYEDKFQVGTHTGNLGWAMITLLSYYEKKGGGKYLEAAIKIGEWIERECRDDRGAGGYTGGYEGWEETANNPEGQAKLLWKSTEHNIDVYVAFMKLYYITREEVWLDGAIHAKGFVEAMWDEPERHFWTGTLEDGVTINKDVLPVDVNTWGLMGLGKEDKYGTGITWVENFCKVDPCPKCKEAGDHWKGFDFSFDRVNASNNKDGIWWEGTAQMCVAYQIDGDSDKSDEFLGELCRVQMSANNNNEKGIVAACHDGVTTGFEYDWGPWVYYNRLHIGAVSWYIFAERTYNPYWQVKTNRSIPPDCDVNWDNYVNVLDMIRVGQHWGETREPHWIREDVNRDGNINVLDMILIGQHWTG